MASSPNASTSCHICACRGDSPNPRFRQKKVSCSLIFPTKTKTLCKEIVGSIRLFLLFFSLARKSSAGDFIKTLSDRAFHADCLSAGLPTRQEQARASVARLTAIKTYYLCCLFNRLNPPRNPIPINIPKGKFLLLIQITFPKEYLLQSSYCCYCLVLFCFPFYSKKTFSSRFSLAFSLICGLLALRL